MFEAFFGGARGGGKLAPLHEPVLTPKGWKAIGDLRIGSAVIDPSTGGAQRVVGVFPQGRQRIWRVTCDDGAWTDAGADHFWAYRLANHHRPGTKRAAQRRFAAEALGADAPRTRWDTLRVGTTAEMARALRAGHSPRLPLTEPVLFDVNGRTGAGTVSAYAAACLLGDGHVPSLTVTCCEDDLRTALMAEGFSAGTQLHSDGRPKDYRAVGQYGKALRQWVHNHGLDGARSWEKFVPAYVLTAGIEYRLAFLQGLMDTDGTVDERGRCYFHSVSRTLAEGVQALARSLGGKAALTERQTRFTHRGEVKDGLPSFQVRVWLRHSSALFRIGRKKARCTDRWNGGAELSREVVSIEEVEPQEAVCIKVSGPRGLYVTRDYLVTHNTDAVLGEWTQHASRHGADAVGLMVRRARVQLGETFERAQAILRPVGAQFTQVPMRVTMPNGARLTFAYLDRDADAEAYQGQSFTRVYVEEAGNFPSPAPILKLMATLRSGAGVPCRMRLTGNPGGPGHGWVRARYIDPAPLGWTPIRDPVTGLSRVYIPSRVGDNRYLGPEYVARLRASGSPELVRAWLDGDWSVVAGAYFPEFSPGRHVIPPRALPAHWTRLRALDWGSARPFAVLWLAVSDGTVPGMPAGALVCYREWYGMGDQPNTGLRLPAEQVAVGIASRERDDRVAYGVAERIAYGVADPAIFASDGGPSVAERMGAAGVHFQPADNRRVPGHGALGGWDQVRARLRGFAEASASAGDDGPGDGPGLLIFASCTHLIRTLPALQHDPARPEDLDSNGEDHAADALRYACMSRPWQAPAPGASRTRHGAQDSWAAAFARDGGGDGPATEGWRTA